MPCIRIVTNALSNWKEVLFLPFFFSYRRHLHPRLHTHVMKNRLSRKMVWNAQFVVIITTPLLTTVVTLHDMIFTRREGQKLTSCKYMPPENKFTVKRSEKGILTLWTQTLSSSLRWKYVLLLERFSFDSNSSLYQFVSNINYICYRTIDAHSVIVFSICILIWFAIIWNSVSCCSPTTF